MTARLNAYLGFIDTAREAMEFYASVFGGEPTFRTFAEFGMGDPAEGAKIMHSELETPSGFVLMCSDAPAGMAGPTGSSISLCLNSGPEDDAELRGYWDRLSDGGTVEEPLVTAPWGDTFGMCTDRFGTRWMVSIGTGQPG
ncbi:VOC family protein [Actinotalea fermentans]|uniref:VOC family protein n=1 Tax=Actinotalea fermentans TaxID=43671 RepID=A0A511YWF5_9CELL|nr:VOC family protein [Actinotalea fermentans]KGM15893.1 3-demethylubiquinone-9 3-methyltransferase [Actinotalea fermentans ATCC 43279 = JCM 9966 = DSM 3133]GEN79543.1 VOC family protein [Actinotalea fermentans]